MPRKLRVEYPGAIYHLMNRVKGESRKKFLILAHEANAAVK